MSRGGYWKYSLTKEATGFLCFADSRKDKQGICWSRLLAAQISFLDFRVAK